MKAWSIVSPHGKPVPTMSGALAWGNRSEAIEAHGRNTFAMDPHGQFYAAGTDCDDHAWRKAWARMRKAGYTAQRVLVDEPPAQLPADHAPTVPFGKGVVGIRFAAAGPEQFVWFYNVADLSAGYKGHLPPDWSEGRTPMLGLRFPTLEVAIEQVSGWLETLQHRNAELEAQATADDQGGQEESE
jgi:hypothetical protein